MSSEDNELNSSIDDAITEEECQKIVAEAIKQNADKDQEDLTAYSTSPVISPDHDLKANRKCYTNRCTNTVDEDNYFHRLAGYCKSCFECNGSLHHDLENQGEKMNKAETEENESDENAIDIESDENVNVSNEIKLNDKNATEDEETATQDEEKEKAFQITQDEEIAKALRDRSNLGRGMRNLTKFAVSRDTNELMFTLMKQNMIIGNSFDISIIPNYEMKFTRIIHYKHTPIDNDKRLYFKIDNIISTHPTIILNHETISFFTKPKIVYHWSLYSGLCSNLVLNKNTQLLFPCVLRDEKSINFSSHLLQDDDYIAITWMITRCETARCDVLLMNWGNKEFTILGKMKHASYSSTFQFLKDKVPLVNVPFDLNEVAYQSNKYFEDNRYYYDQERYPTIDKNTKNFRAQMDLIEKKSTSVTKSQDNVSSTKTNTRKFDAMTSPNISKNQNSSSSNSKTKKAKTIIRREERKRIKIKEKTASNSEILNVESDESDNDIRVHSQVYVATLKKETEKELATRAREFKQQQATAKKEMSIAIANLKKECNTEVQKRKEVNAGIEKAQTELKRLREEIEAFEEIKRAKELQLQQKPSEIMSQEIHTTAKELQSKQKPPEALHQEMKPVENTFVNPSGITQNPPTLFNPSFSMPTINTNSTDNAFFAYNYGMQSNFLTSQLNFNNNAQAMQQSYNQSTQSLQQAYLAYLSSKTH